MTDTQKDSPQQSGTTASSIPKTVGLTPVKKRRRPWLWAVSILLIALGALLAASVVNSMRDTVPVVVAAAPITRGEPITAAQLTTVEVHPDELLATTPGDKLNQLVGKTAQMDVPKGVPLAPNVAGGKLQPGQGQALVGVALTPSQRPVGNLSQGKKVQLIYTPRQGDDYAAEAEPVAIDATVLETQNIRDTNLVVVNVAVAAQHAPQLASINATGRLALILKEA